MYIVYARFICSELSGKFFKKYKEKTKDARQSVSGRPRNRCKLVNEDKKKEASGCRGSSNDGFMGMKQNKSSEVIPLRPRVADANAGWERNMPVLCSSRQEETAVAW